MHTVDAVAASALLDDLLRRVVDLGASDLHLTVGRPPTSRVAGELRPLDGDGVLDAATTHALVDAALTEPDRARFAAARELDTAYAVAGVGRFRVAAFVQRGSVGAVFRVIPMAIPPLESLELPSFVPTLARAPRGLVLVTGPTGSGKSTTLAALLDRINRERALHIVTVEDPIEFLHHHRRSVVNQREVGSDTPSFGSALRHVLRQDPDVVLVGEMRDLETIAMALTAAETGHLVLASLHTQDAPGAVDRIIDVFPPGQQAQIRIQLVATLRAVVAQQLVPRRDGHGRAVACEVLVATPAVRNLIREAKLHQLPSVMQSGSQFGMQTMDQALAALVRDGVVDADVAAERSHDPDGFRLLAEPGFGAVPRPSGAGPVPVGAGHGPPGAPGGGFGAAASAGFPRDW
jgi:twitching motility protein PilT